jgi:hypothetical protein
MKKVILTLAVAIIALSANAQHKFFLGLGASIKSSTGTSTLTGGTSSDAPKGMTGSLNPYLGYSVTENIAVGLGLNIDGGSTSTKNTTPSYTLKDKNSSFGIMPFVRYTTKINDNFGMWGQLNVGPTFGKSTEENYDGTKVYTDHQHKNSGFDVNIKPGFNYTLGERWIFTGSYGKLGYANTKTTHSQADATNNNTLKEVSVVKSSDIELSLDWHTLQIGFNFLF